MRLNSNFSERATNEAMVGSLLLAHPELQDPNFTRSVILLTAHTPSDGALGVVLNRPLSRKLVDIKPELAGSALAEVPLYRGGPVSSDQAILAAWKYEAEQGAFKLYFGMDEAKAAQIKAEDPAYELRAFMGYSGWSENQLENELSTDSWILSQLKPYVGQATGDPLWRKLLLEVSPELGLWADE
ncbi:MAG: YqgE/AlgH family protein, partial [Opitutales bacterium]